MSRPESLSAGVAHSGIAVRAFRPGDEACFRRLTEEWITRYFRVEPKDEQIFADPQTYILQPGGMILFAEAEEQCVGCCALIRMDEHEFEVAKMGVTPAFQGRGVGRILLQAVIEAARSLGAHRLYLETNHTLQPAIQLYESLGFVSLPPDRVTPSPYARADVFMEMLLPGGK